MKFEIDKLVRQIRHNLDQASMTRPPELDAVSHGLRGFHLSQADGLRATIERLVDDMMLADDVREYARQQLAGLPPF